MNAVSSNLYIVAGLFQWVLVVCIRLQAASQQAQLSQVQDLATSRAEEVSQLASELAELRKIKNKLTMDCEASRDDKIMLESQLAAAERRMGQLGLQRETLERVRFTGE